MSDTMQEIQALWDSGHAEALTGFGMMCAEKAVEGYKKGAFRGTLIGFTIGAAMSVTALCLASAVKKKKTP